MNKSDLEIKIYCLSSRKKMYEQIDKEGRNFTKEGIEIRKREEKQLKKYESMLEKGDYITI